MKKLFSGCYKMLSLIAKFWEKQYQNFHPKAKYRRKKSSNTDISQDTFNSGATGLGSACNTTNRNIPMWKEWLNVAKVSWDYISKFGSWCNTNEMFHPLTLTENKICTDIESFLKCFILYFERKQLSRLNVVYLKLYDNLL